MIAKSNQMPIIFTTDNEPYLGRETVYVLDRTIIACLKLSEDRASLSHTMARSKMQDAACQLIPESINSALSARELVRQGYLFGAFLLLRPLMERCVTLLYLQKHPEDIAKWNLGWEHKSAPSLATMVKKISGTDFHCMEHIITGPLNAAIHGKPACAYFKSR